MVSNPAMRGMDVWSILPLVTCERISQCIRFRELNSAPLRTAQAAFHIGTARQHVQCMGDVNCLPVSYMFLVGFCLFVFVYVRLFICSLSVAPTQRNSGRSYGVLESSCFALGFSLCDLWEKTNLATYGEIREEREDPTTTWSTISTDTH